MDMKWPGIALQRWGSDALRRMCERGDMGLSFSERPMANFLNALSAAERQAFIALGRERTFARGAELMQEGEWADYVVLIREGRVAIIVRENEGVRVIADRGPGDLIGERAALRVNVRSATVVARDTVHALVVRTEDFAGFITAHPRVLDIVENQIYGRLTEEAVQRYREKWTPVPGADRVGVHAGADARLPLLAGENCTVVLTDIVEFGAPRRTDADRREIRRVSFEMTRAALSEIWDTCICEDRGDGLLIVAPPEVITTRVMQGIDQEFPGMLREYNRTYSEPLRIRLRVAVNVGPVVGDDLGISGSAIIRTARMVEAPVLKRAMTAGRAHLGIIISPFVYDTVLGTAGELIGYGQYRAVEVDLKETRTGAWMRLAS
jgi:hypothetical protein